MGISFSRVVEIIFISLLIVHLVILPIFGQQTNTISKKEIIITAANFQNNTGKKEYKGLKEAIPNSIITNLAASGKVSVVERSQLEEALEEMKLSMEGITSEKTAAKAGKAVGASVIIVGDFFTIGDKIRINTRLIKVETAKIVFGESVQGPTGEEIFGLIDKLANAVLADLTGKKQVRNLPPVASFSFTPRNPRMREKVTFNAGKSREPDGKIVSYQWDFNGDGNVDAEGITVNHHFQSIGSKLVVLKVIDNRGATNSMTQKIETLSPTNTNQEKMDKKTEKPQEVSPDITKSIKNFSTGRGLGIITIYYIPMLRFCLTNYIMFDFLTDFDNTYLIGASFKLLDTRQWDFYIGGKLAIVRCGSGGVLLLAGIEYSFSISWSVYAELGFAPAYSQVLPFVGIAYYF